MHNNDKIAVEIGGIVGFLTTKVRVSSQGIAKNKNFIATGDVLGISAGLTARYLNGFKQGTDGLIIVRSANNGIKLEFEGIYYTTSATKKFELIFNAIMRHQGASLLSRIFRHLEQGGVFEIGNADFSKQGVRYVKHIGPLKTGETFHSYAGLRCTQDNV